jgi:GxxExxY protein
MVCSNCKQEGHTKPKCKNPSYVSPPQSVQEDVSTPIILTDDIIKKLTRLANLCKEVAGGLGKGHVEGVYQQALCFELQDAGVRYVSEETMPILYKGRPVGGGHSQRLDVALLSYLPFIFELKAVSKPISPEHHWQLVRYLDYKQQPYGAVVNFNQSDKGSLEVQFIVKQDGIFYLYDMDTGSGSELSDFGLVKTAEEWGWE